jgi:uncharacterized protein (DUF1697 family)
VSDRQVALLRGINVGRAKRVAMADLRALVEELGYGDVRTLLNSGNVVYSAPKTAPEKAAAAIEAALVKRTGVSSKVIVLSAAELSDVIDQNPLVKEAAANPSRLLVAVLADPADRKKLELLAKEDWEPEALAVGKRAAYLWCPDGISAGRLADEALRLLGDRTTTRNWATMLKLQALAEPSP